MERTFQDIFNTEKISIEKNVRIKKVPRTFAFLKDLFSMLQHCRYILENFLKDIKGIF